MCCCGIYFWSRCCAAYSVFGACFTAWVTVMCAEQSFYLAHMTDHKKSENSAFGAMIMFISVFVISTTYILVERTRGGQNDGDENLPKGMETYALPAGVTANGGYAPLSSDGLNPGSSSAPAAGGLSQTTPRADPLVLS
uniref:Uncharacterized protein n=1 Tax=Eucampia antarctica TaxID=49252 RepID=A0A7S2VY28_9STRA|mmetsp:Transcript_11386/g.10895  ORF Transcript_11386/g.10895 Transcript_11386/m.10895 type:complete len:139 (+) Transcript_11386:176-592(+)